ncbi:MAG: flagellar brake protein [Nitrospinae bacterium]|nr:flagellar brake protein [Nitrospinota bacterium]MBI3814063.1 flagellar brake protein [Nitrospinota bacterium]
MIKALKDLLKRDDGDKEKALSSNALTTQSQIVASIGEVCQKSLNLIATIDDRAETFGSIFIELGKGNDSIIIDTLMPKYGNRLVEESNRINVEYIINGVKYSFRTRFLEMVRGSLPAIKIAVPSFIKKFEKRKFFRISPSNNSPVAVEVTKGFVEDVTSISEEGVSFYTRRSEREITMGMVFEKITFKLPTTDQKITAKAVVRNFIKGTGAKNRCGVEFVDMRRQDKDYIAYYGIIRQREIVSQKLLK